MATIIPIPVVMEFEQDTEQNFKGVRHYKLTQGTSLFSEKLNISNDRNCAKSSPTFWLKIRKHNKWSGCITGLFPTNDPDIFYGDTENKRNFILFKFTDNGRMLRLYYFQNFYTRCLTAFLKTFKEHY